MRPPGAMSPSFSALGHSFGIRCADPDVRRDLHGLVEAFASDRPVAAWYDVIADVATNRWRLTYGDQLIAEHLHRSEIAEWLIWHVNQAAIASDDDHLLLHAAVTARKGVAVLIPGPAGAGKSSLAAALLQHGMEYLSDELAVIDPQDLGLTAYPKPLSLGRSAYELIGELGFGSLHVASTEGGAPAAGGRWSIPVRANARTQTARIGLIVVPRFRPTEPTSLLRLDVGDTLLHLAACAFRFEDKPGPHLGLLTRIASTTPAYVASTTDLIGAAQLVLQAHDIHAAPKNAGHRRTVHA